MLSSDNKSLSGLTADTTIDTPLLRGAHVHESPRSAQAQTLLNALQNFIVPLIYGISGQETKSINHTDLWSPEAEEFLIALQKFITVTIRSQSVVQDPVEANRGGAFGLFPTTTVSQPPPASFPWDNTTPGNIVKLAVHEASAKTSHVNMETLPNAPMGDTIIDLKLYNGGTSVESQQPTLGERVMVALRQHVFNSMPIRLLCFKPNGYKYDITLLERAEIFAHLVSQLRVKFRGPQFLSDIERDVLDQADIFTEERLIKTWLSKQARYAILSHTWIDIEPGEVTFSTWRMGSLDFQQSGAEKLVNFCKVAAEDYGFTLGWMDTVCINKDSSAELDESIRSMYKWYMQANVCVTYLSQTEVISDMHKDRWFTRGWTLQELLAPHYIKFYNRAWKRLIVSLRDDKQSTEIQQQITLATSITASELMPHASVSFSRKMQWAATRKVTREEDIAYSLMGIFRVGISIAYGEGRTQAFFRLVKEVLSSHRDIFDIFNWAGKFATRTSISCLIPSSPQAYVYSTDLRFQDRVSRVIEPIILTHLGLRIPVILMPALSVPSQKNSTSELQYSYAGDYYAVVNVKPLPFLQDNIPNTYNLLDKRISGRDGCTKDRTWFQISFALLAFTGNETKNIFIPKTCLAVGLVCTEESGRVTTSSRVQKIQTEVPIVFDINRRGNKDYDLVSHSGYSIQRSQLADHGMQLVNMYL